MWVKINDATVNSLFNKNQQCSKALADDMAQVQEGCLWSHIQDMAKRGLIVIENDVATLLMHK